MLYAWLWYITLSCDTLSMLISEVNVGRIMEVYKVHSRLIGVISSIDGASPGCTLTLDWDLILDSVGELTYTINWRKYTNSLSMHQSTCWTAIIHVQHSPHIIISVASVSHNSVIYHNHAESMPSSLTYYQRWLVIFQSYALYVEIKHESNKYHLYNLLVPQEDEEAGRLFEALERHCAQHDRGDIIIGGDFNCTTNPSVDRLGISYEKVTK